MKVPEFVALIMTLVFLLRMCWVVLAMMRGCGAGCLRHSWWLQLFCTGWLLRKGTEPGVLCEGLRCARYFFVFSIA
jgi:hypothetical protein